MEIGRDECCTVLVSEMQEERGSWERMESEGACNQPDLALNHVS